MQEKTMFTREQVLQLIPEMVARTEREYVDLRSVSDRRGIVRFDRQQDGFSYRTTFGVDRGPLSDHSVLVAMEEYQGQRGFSVTIRDKSWNVAGYVWGSFIGKNEQDRTAAEPLYDLYEAAQDSAKVSQQRSMIESDRMVAQENYRRRHGHYPRPAKSHGPLDAYTHHMPNSTQSNPQILEG